MRAIWISLLCCVFTAAAALGGDSNITLTVDGVTFEDVRWGAVTPTTVSIFHRTGAATIPLKKLPADLQKQFGYDPNAVPEPKALPQKAELPSAASAQNTSGRKHPAEIKGLASVSVPGDQTVIAFKNNSKSLRRVYWLDFKGQRQRYMELKPGDTADQKTYLGHPWLVTDPEDNALGLYYPDAQKRIVILE